MADARFVAMEVGQLNAAQEWPTFEEAAEQAARYAERNSTPFAVVRVVGEVRVVKQTQVERFDREGADGQA